MRSLFTGAIVCATIFSSLAANPPNLAMLAAKSAAVVKAAIPGSEGAVQGSLAVVKTRTKFAPKRKTAGKIEIPDAYGVMFIIEYHPAPYRPKEVPAPVISNRPEFGAWRATNPALHLPDVPLRTVAVQEFANSNTVMVVDVLFGQHTDTHMLEQAWRALSRFAESQLRH